MDAGEIERLLGRCALGDRSAFRRLYDEAAPKLFGVSLRILANRGDAEEATQEAFVRIWQRAGRFRSDRGSAPGWIVAIARNAAIDRLRPAQGARPATSPTWSTSPIPARRRRRAPRRRTSGGGSRAASAGFPRTGRARCGAPISRDIATRSWRATFEVPLNTMRTWLRRALIALRKCLEA